MVEPPESPEQRKARILARMAGTPELATSPIGGGNGGSNGGSYAENYEAESPEDRRKRVLAKMAGVTQEVAAVAVSDSPGVTQETAAISVSEELPSGWYEAKAPDGRSYFYAPGERTVWRRPTKAVWAGPSASESRAQLDRSYGRPRDLLTLDDFRQAAADSPRDG